ncbi:phosphoenolpyruvate carboxylase, partial [Roseicella aquatilis]
GIIARRTLLDVMRRVRCFGVHLVRHDIRQDSARHTEALSEITRCLGLGDYADWDEDARRAFLLRELGNPRPLVPRRWQPSAPVQEVLDTCAVAAEQAPEALG